MPKIRLILIALFGMFLLGCASGGKRNSTFTQKRNVINCGKNAKVINSECFEAQAKVQEARRKARRKSDHDSWCGTACLSAKKKNNSYSPHIIISIFTQKKMKQINAFNMQKT